VENKSGKSSCKETILRPKTNINKAVDGKWKLS
jgi:hypothetical protein